MGEIYNLGINLIIAFQSLGSWLLAPMRFFTFFGSEQFFLFVLPVVFWCLDARLGIRLGILLGISIGLNGVLKLALHSPRPTWLSEQVKAYASETGFGIPSGHSQNGMVIWGLLAAWGKRRWMWWAAGTIAFLTGLSRMYLGVHFPSDVLAGWLVGGILLWAYLTWLPGATRWLDQKTLWLQICLAWLFSLAFILLGYLAQLSLGAWTIPSEWVSLAASAHPVATNIAPLALSPLVTASAGIFGIAAGAIIIKPMGGFDTSGDALKYAFRMIIGLAGVAILYAGLGALFPRGEEFLPLVLRYLRYTLVGAWISGFAPMLFIRLRIAKPLHR